MQHNCVTKSLYKASSEANCYRATVEIICFFFFTNQEFSKVFVRAHQLSVFDPFRLEALCNSSYHAAPLRRECFKLSPSEG